MQVNGGVAVLSEGLEVGAVEEVEERPVRIHVGRTDHWVAIPSRFMVGKYHVSLTRLELSLKVLRAHLKSCGRMPMRLVQE